MGNALRGAVPHSHDKSALICQSVPGHFLSQGDAAGAARILTGLVDAAGTGWIPSKLGVRSTVPDPLTHFWFAHAAYAYWKTTKDQETWAAKLLPMIKRMVQGMISGAFAGTTMNDGGMLMGVDDEPMFVNSLWYNAMGILAEQLPLVGDRAGDHFERLGGRFRRSYLKAFWCDQHNCLCDSGIRDDPAHNAADYLPPPTQSVNATLPFSAIPRTKQRQAIDAVRKHGLREMGMIVGGATVTDAARHHHGGHVSPLFLAWLAEGHVRTSDTPATAVAEATAWIAPLKHHLDRTAVLAEHYKTDATSATDAGKPHGPTMDETLRVWLWLTEMGQRPLGNSKRTRI